MNRRASLSTLLGKSKKQEKNTSPKARTVTGLEEYTGPWEFKQAAHLLRRTMFGPNWQQILLVVNNGLEATVNQLLSPTTPLAPEPPINYYDIDDPNVAIGETWINSPLLTNYIPRVKSLEGWTVKQVLDEEISIKERMTLFWHNHFATGGFPTEPRYKYIYISTLRENVLGNFKELVKNITVDPLMLRYLNGKGSEKTAPNENYARELLELFTIGKGPLIAPGDYSNYKESDISEIARILTGWDTVDNQGLIGSFFVPSNHDTGIKYLSEYFNSAQISDAGEDEYKNLIDIIFEQDEVARFICRKIYRWFVHYKIDDNIEASIIEPLAQILIDNNYEVYPVIETLLKSQHFYNDELIGCMIKNPWEFVLGMIKQFQVEFPSDPAIYYESFRVIFKGTFSLQMEYYDLPSVAGWKAYYQAPAYYRLWLNSVTLPQRSFIADTLTSFGVPLWENPSNLVGFTNAAFLQILNNLTNPWEREIIVEDFVKLLFPKDIADNQKVILKNILPDTWTTEYSNYIGDPTNESLANSIRGMIKDLIVKMLAMPEYQLM